jgi:hypothetical protein
MAMPGCFPGLIFSAMHVHESQPGVKNPGGSALDLPGA